MKLHLISYQIIQGQMNFQIGLRFGKMAFFSKIEIRFNVVLREIETQWFLSDSDQQSFKK
jgi:hypothetical protein